MFAPLGNPGEKHSHSQCSASLCREGEWVMTADRNVSEADFSLTGANLQNSLQASTTCAQDALCFSCLTLKVGSCVLCPVTWAFFCLFQRDTRLQLRCAGRPSFRQFSLARPACPFFNLHQSSPDLVRLVNTCLHRPVHCSPMPALYCCQLVWARYGTVRPIRVSSDWFSPPGFLYGSFFCHWIISSCPPYPVVKAWIWLMLLSTSHPYRRTSLMLVLNFLPRQMTWPLSLMFPPGWWTGSLRWSPCPHCWRQGTSKVNKRYKESGLPKFRLPADDAAGGDMVSGNKPHLSKTSSHCTMILIRTLLETGRTKSACQQPHCDSLLVLGTYTVWLMRPTKKGNQHKTEC